MNENRTSAREGIVSMAVAILLLAISGAVTAAWGYDRPAESIRYILGIPDWIFWGVLLPWAAATAFTGWFALRYMKDEDLGSERDEEAP